MGLAPHVDSPRHQLDTQGQGAKSGASAGAGKQAEGTYRPSPRPQAPPRERSPSDPRQPLGAPHLGSRDALLAFGAQVSLWPGWSLWGDTEGFPERPCSGSVTHSPAPDTCLRPQARQGLLLQFLGLMGSPHPVRERYSRESQRSPHGPAERGQSGPPLGEAAHAQPIPGCKYLGAWHACQHSLSTGQQSHGERRKGTTFTTTLATETHGKSA